MASPASSLPEAAAACPLTEGEHSFYSQQPVCHVAAQLFSFEPASTLGLFFDSQHGRLLHHVGDVLYIVDVTKSHPKLAKGYPIRRAGCCCGLVYVLLLCCFRFAKPKCMSMSFSPCGNFLLYVTAQPSPAAAAAAAAGEAGGGSAPGGRSSAGGEGCSGGPAPGSTRGGGAPRECLRQEVGIVAVFESECLSTVAPLRGASACEELPNVLQAFWAAALPNAAHADPSSLVVVITQKNIELFRARLLLLLLLLLRFVHEGKRLHALKKVPQASLLAWVSVPPLKSSAQAQPAQPATEPAPSSPAAAAAAAAAAFGPVVFVVAVGQRTLQPFLLDSKTLSLVRLPKIELNLPLWQALQQRDVHVLSLYETAYCVHADSHAGRISLRAITGPLQADTVLDALAPGELQLLALDNMLVVYHTALESVLLFDVHRSHIYGAPDGQGPPSLASQGGGVEGSPPLAAGGGPPSLRLKGKAAGAPKPDPSKAVRALVPLVRGTPLAAHAAPSFAAGEAAAADAKRTDSEQAAGADGLTDVELQATNLEVARFVSPDVVIDDELGSVYRLSLNVNALMHRVLKEKQSLVLQNRSHSKAEVIRLALHALRLETPLAELQPLLYLLISKYRAAIEQVPLSVVAVSRQQAKKGGAAAAAAAAAAGAGAPAARAAAAAAAGEEGAGGPMACGRATIPLELLLQSIGSQTVLTERDLVFQVFYPFVRQQYGLPPDALLLDACFSADSASGATPPSADGGPPKPCSLTAAGGSGGGLVLSSRRGNTSSELPYILSVALEYTRSLLTLQIFPHKVLQAFLFDACAFFKRGDVLKQLLQYHLLLDSVELGERLFVIWRQLAAAAAAGDSAAARDECWLRQACLDAALRLKDWMSFSCFPLRLLLLLLLQHKEIIPLLREHGAWDYPLKRVLHAVAADVKAQEEQPFLLQQVLGHVRAWVSECKAREAAKAPPLPPPNLRDCGAWLPGVGEETPPQQTVKRADQQSHHQQQQQQQQQQQDKQQQDEEEEEGEGADSAGDAAAATPSATTTTPPNKDPQLIEAIGVVAHEYSDAPVEEGEEEAARGWATLADSEGVCASLA
ncbi:hypothetical protein Efla_003503 [Eimeria flavescens]